MVTPSSHTYNSTPHTYAYGFLFVFSTSMLILGGNYWIVAFWLLIWIFTYKFSNLTGGTEYLIFIMGYYYFYPLFNGEYKIPNHPNIVLGFILVMFVVIYWAQIREQFKHNSKLFKFIIWGWFLWAIICYTPVFFATIAKNTFISDFNMLPRLSMGSTGLKSIIAILLCPIISLIPILCLKKPYSIDAFWKVVTFGALSVCFLAFLHFVFNIEIFLDDSPFQDRSAELHEYRLGGLAMPDPNGFGRQLLLPLLFLSSLAIISWKRKKLLINTLTLLLVYCCVILTLSRTTYVSMGISIIILLIAIGSTYKKKNVINYVVLTLALILLVYNLTGVSQQFKPGSERLSTVNLDFRKNIYEVALQIVWENPIFGSFPGNYEDAMRDYGYQERNVVSAHNMYLHVATEWGLPMTFLLILANIIPILNGIRLIKLMNKIGQGDLLSNIDSIKSMAFGTAALSVAYFIHGITEIVPPYYVFLNLGISEALRNMLKQGPFAPRPGNNPPEFLAPRPTPERVSIPWGQSSGG